MPIALVILLSASPAAAPASLPRGQIIENVQGAAPDQNYALYLPTTYDPARPAAIVYILDARGRALVPMERFRPGAETLGIVLASSYRSRSDVATSPNGPALSAMWTDTHARLALDERRAFLAGFSGTARAAWSLASAAKGAIAGVIAAGAGLPGPPPLGGMGFLYFAAVGDTDFNYREMQELDRTLFELGASYRYEVFPGPHDWMPEAVATRALEWMAFRTARAPADSLEAALARDVARARGLEAEGSLQAAWRLWSWMARDYAGRLDTSQASARAAALAASPARMAEDKAARKSLEQERLTLERARRAIAQALATSDDPSALPRLASDLGLARLKRRAQGQGAEALSAERVLSSLQSQLAYYLPRDASERGAHAEAAFFLAIAAEIRPEDPQVLYRLAAAQARAGKSKAALSALERAVGKGFSDRARLESDPDFASLRREAGFERLFARLP